MKILGAHVILYSKKPEADRKFFRDVLRYDFVDGGWPIFALPPAEIAVHPSDDNDVHELYLMCDDVEAFIAAMKKKKIECGPVSKQRWGLLTSLALPGGGTLGVYQPLHESPVIKIKRATSARGASRSRDRSSRGRRAS